MKLDFSPVSCSLAARIALYEAALDGETTFHKVSLRTKRSDEDADYWAIPAKGQVPALPPAESRDFVPGTILPQKLDYLESVLGARPCLVGETFTVEDAYLMTCLNWCLSAKVDRGPWPSLAAYHRRMLERPQARRAIREERGLVGAP